MPQNLSRTGQAEDVTTVPLANVNMLEAALVRAMSRPPHLPGIVCFYGPAGWGKTKSATYAAVKHGGYYIHCMAGWNRRAVLHYILQVMGLPPATSVWRMTEQVCEQLAVSGRPLLVDEVDKLVEKKSVELIRDLYDGSGAAVLLIGEETLPARLARWERLHSRVLEWVPAQPVSVADCKTLAALYCPDTEIGDDLLAKIAAVSRGSARRVVVNLELARRLGVQTGQKKVGMKEWGKREFYMGEAKARVTP